ncbi:MAG TPA: oligosaccharide repeat unit polymerase [Acinetobacter towneri]|nr:oligosaccharide repeat unit polymerase [Acinetobacter towneri]
MINLNKFFNIFFEPRNAYLLLIFIILVFYALPSLILFFIKGEVYDYQLFFLAFLAISGLFIGANSKSYDSFFLKKKKNLNPQRFVNFFFFVFIINMFLVIYVRPDIPLFNALIGGVTQQELSAQRGYLKNASGLAFFVNYINVALLNSIIPLCIGMSFYYNLKFKKIILLMYIGFAILFLQKALFISAILPVLVALKMRNKLKFGKLFFVVIFIFSLLYFLTSVSVDKSVGYYYIDKSLVSFFSANFETGSSLEFLIWRSIGIPYATAIDTLKFFDIYLNNIFLLGSTSSIISLFLGMERVNVEQLVFLYQYSSVNFFSEDSIGRANSIFLVDAYINFSWFGVFIISFIIGLIFRGFWKSNENVWSVLFLLFLIQLSSVGFIGILLSGGYFFVLILMLNYDFKSFTNSN